MSYVYHERHDPSTLFAQTPQLISARWKSRPNSKPSQHGELSCTKTAEVVVSEPPWMRGEMEGRSILLRRWPCVFLIPASASALVSLAVCFFFSNPGPSVTIHVVEYFGY